MQITRSGYVLVDMKTGNPVCVGDEVVDFRGEKWRVQAGAPPHKPASTGRIYVSSETYEYTSEFFPSVCDLKWVLASADSTLQTA
jgi:hypothetical protein